MLFASSNAEQYSGGKKLGHRLFWLIKPIFYAISTIKKKKKNITNTPITPTNHFINSKYLKVAKKTKNQTRLVLTFSVYIYINFNAPNNHYEAPLIFRKSWTPRKPILVAENRVNHFLSYFRI